MTEKDFRRVFARTGWAVDYDVVAHRLTGQYQARVVLRSGALEVIAGTTTRCKSWDNAAFRRVVFANAARDLRGAFRPDSGCWFCPGFARGGDRLPAPQWFRARGGTCAVSSVEEFALRLALLAPGPAPEDAR